METRLVSADSHVMEPPDLWLKSIGPRFGDRPHRSDNWLIGPAIGLSRPALHLTRWRMASVSEKAARNSGST